MAWKLTKPQLKAVNKRSNHLGGEPNWIPPQMNLIEKTYKLKAVDFVRMSRGAAAYLFEGVFDGKGQENQKQAFEAFTECLRLCLTMHVNADGRPLKASAKEEMATLIEMCAESLSLLEMCCPHILFDRLLHEILHVPMMMLRWNSCRNYWSFGSER
jgi:hypothetical protein